jgi:cytoskeletal protein CcmA (bactofilin family)
MFNKRPNYDRIEPGDALTALDRELGSEGTPAPNPPTFQAPVETESQAVTKSATGETIIAEGCNFNGKATVAGTLRVEGKAQGEVRASDTVIVGRTGRLEANVVTNKAILSGTYNGKVEAKDRVELQNGSRVEGDIVATNMVMEDGVYFRGNCQIGTK